MNRIILLSLFVMTTACGVQPTVEKAPVQTNTTFYENLEKPEAKGDYTVPSEYRCSARPQTNPINTALTAEQTEQATALMKLASDAYANGDKKEAEAILKHVSDLTIKGVQDYNNECSVQNLNLASGGILGGVFELVFGGLAAVTSIGAGALLGFGDLVHGVFSASVVSACSIFSSAVLGMLLCGGGSDDGGDDDSDDTGSSDDNNDDNDSDYGDNCFERNGKTYCLVDTGDDASDDAGDDAGDDADYDLGSECPAYCSTY